MPKFLTKPTDSEGNVLSTEKYVDNALISKANSADVYTKSETDNQITQKVSEIVADAPEDFDTLKEMSDWISSHEGSAAEMNSKINTNSENITNLQTNTYTKSEIDSKIGDIETILSSIVEVK